MEESISSIDNSQLTQSVLFTGQLFAEQIANFLKLFIDYRMEYVLKH